MAIHQNKAIAEKQTHNKHDSFQKVAPFSFLLFLPIIFS